MDIPEGSVLAHAKRHGWTQEIQVATQDARRLQSDAITVPPSLVAILAERKDRTRLGLSRYAAEAAEQAAQHPDKLGIARRVNGVAGAHKTLWPDQTETKPLTCNTA
jgi:hypothetical protein